MEKWDEVIIKTEFMKGIISKVLRKALKKAGYDTEFQLDEFHITNKDEKVHIRLSADMEMSTAEIEEVVKKIL